MVASSAPKAASSGFSANASPNNNYGKVAKNDYNDRAAKGQALNLAVSFAIAEGKQNDDAYILSLVPRMIKLGEAVQNGDYKEQAAAPKPAAAPKAPDVSFDDDIFADLDL